MPAKMITDHPHNDELNAKPRKEWTGVGIALTSPDSEPILVIESDTHVITVGNPSDFLAAIDRRFKKFRDLQEEG